jgi:hypothetical protein
MQTVLNSYEELTINIIMMVKQYVFYIFWASFCRGKFVLLQNWMVVLWDNKLSFHGVGIFWPLFIVQCRGISFLFVVIEY